MSDLTTLLDAVRTGDPAAVDRLCALLYRELHQMARARLKRERDAVLGATSLVHETYLRLLKRGQVNSSNRAQFCAYAARVMRSIIVDIVRQRQAEKHGGDIHRVTLDSHLMASIQA